MVNTLSVFALSLVVVIVLLIYVHFRVGKFTLESHHVFASARSSMSEIEEQEKEIFRQNQMFIEINRNTLNQVAVINNLLFKIKVLLEDALELNHDERKK